MSVLALLEGNVQKKQAAPLFALLGFVIFTKTLLHQDDASMQFEQSR